MFIDGREVHVYFKNVPWVVHIVDGVLSFDSCLFPSGLLLCVSVVGLSEYSERNIWIVYGDDGFRGVEFDTDIDAWVLRDLKPGDVRVLECVMDRIERHLACSVGGS
jgi:hypothetical protein